MPKVSVLMPVFNARNYLAEAIESIVSQEFSDWELIIVNDGSIDDSEDIIQSFGDKRIRYYKNDGNKGIIYSRKLLIEKASGQYIAFLDSDDIALPQRLKIQTEFLDDNPDYGLCGSWGILIDEKGRKMKNLKLFSEHNEIRCGLLFGNVFIQSSMMIRKSLFDSETYDSGFPVAEDYDLWCRLSAGHKMKNIPKYLIKYREHESNISREKEKQMNKLLKDIFRREIANNLGIRADERELNIHLVLRKQNAIKIKNGAFFYLLDLWLYKITGANQLCRTYNHDIFRATVCFYWMFCCLKRKAFFRMFSFPVSVNTDVLRKLLQMIAGLKFNLGKR